MATIKSFTSLEQSKTLAEILPLESADMHYNNVSIKGINYVDEYRAELTDFNTALKVLSKYLVNPMFGIVPCWSLASLLGVLPNNENISTNLSKGGYRISTLEYTNRWFVEYEDETNGLNNGVILKSADNAIDACYEMILKLHEQKML